MVLQALRNSIRRLVPVWATKAITPKEGDSLHFTLTFICWSSELRQ